MNELVPDDALLPELIAPEQLRIAEVYLTNGMDPKKTAIALEIDEQEVRRILNTPQVLEYTREVFRESGFRNKHRLFSVLDEIVNRKLEEIEESGLGTELDIIELLDKYQKILDMVTKREMALEKHKVEVVRPGAPNTQNNTQININNVPGDANMHKLMSRLVGGKGV